MNRETVFRGALNAMHYTGAARVLAPGFRGIGAFLMLHHIVPGGGLQTGFAPNSGLEITPEFLGDVIQFVREQGYDIVSIDKSFEILTGKVVPDRPFVVFTIDDGYRDNLVHALPVFEAHDCPFTIFIAPMITDGRSELWWRALEAVIQANTTVAGDLPDGAFELAALSVADKRAAFERLYWPVRTMGEAAQREWIRRFSAQFDVDLDAMCAAAAMNWDEVRQIAAHDLCTIGAHTINHFAVARLSGDEALAEMVGSADRIERELGKRPAFFAYPYGDETSAGPRDFELARKAGFLMALTTRKGLVYDAHRAHLTGLPRLSLNGSYQELHYLGALLSGVPFALFNRFRRVNVA